MKNKIIVLISVTLFMFVYVSCIYIRLYPLPKDIILTITDAGMSTSHQNTTTYEFVGKNGLLVYDGGLPYRIPGSSPIRYYRGCSRHPYVRAYRFTIPEKLKIISIASKAVDAVEKSFSTCEWWEDSRGNLHADDHSNTEVIIPADDEDHSVLIDGDSYYYFSGVKHSGVTFSFHINYQWNLEQLLYLEENNNYYMTDGDPRLTRFAMHLSKNYPSHKKTPKDTFYCWAERANWDIKLYDGENAKN